MKTAQIFPQWTPAPTTDPRTDPLFYVERSIDGLKLVLAMTGQDKKRYTFDFLVTTDEAEPGIKLRRIRPGIWSLSRALDVDGFKLYAVLVDMPDGVV